MEVHIPAHPHGPGGASPTYAAWKFNDAIRIRSRIQSDGASIHQHIGLADAGPIADLLYAKIGDIGTRNDAVAPL
jgi:hypothetical protein